MNFHCVSRHWIGRGPGGVDNPHRVQSAANSDDPIRGPTPPDPRAELQWNRPLSSRAGQAKGC
eukprot:365660-Chlamydomonas_euryale.AAC.16